MSFTAASNPLKRNLASGPAAPTGNRAMAMPQAGEGRIDCDQSSQGSDQPISQPSTLRHHRTVSSQLHWPTQAWVRCAASSSDWCKSSRMIPSTARSEQVSSLWMIKY
eukprot:scpid43941/ scgid24093/ 